MLLSKLVQTSRRIAETSKRLEKIDLIAGLIQAATADEVEIVVAYLSGFVLQGNIGIGPALLRESRPAPAAQDTLQLSDVDRELAQLAAVRGSGSSARRRELLQSLF